MWPFDKSWPLDMRFFILNRRYDLPPHRPSHFELVHIDTGEFIYEVEGVKLLLRKGDLVVISNKLYHRGLKTSNMRPETRATILYVTPKLLEAWCAAADEFQCLIPFLYQKYSTPHVVLANSQTPAKVFELFQMLQLRGFGHLASIPNGRKNIR